MKAHNAVLLEEVEKLKKQHEHLIEQMKDLEDSNIMIPKGKSGEPG